MQWSGSEDKSNALQLGIGGNQLNSGRPGDGTAGTKGLQQQQQQMRTVAFERKVIQMVTTTAADSIATSYHG